MRNWNAYEEKHRNNIEAQEDFEIASLDYYTSIELDKYFK